MNMFMLFERHHEPLLPLPRFWGRLIRSAAVGLAIFVGALLIGMVGYHHFEHMPWLDAFANSSMILSGMGPLMALTTPGGKLFAGVYALFSGLAFTATLGFCLAPVAHRLMHHFHAAHEGQHERR